jgi:NAD(P)-dependent dehydrogenase (short-subunit alcohol dehydrogenase family)
VARSSAGDGDEHVVLVTGATDGLGKALARSLAASGATVLLHGRDAARGETTVAELRAQTGNGTHAFYRADFASLREVRGIAKRVVAEHDRLTALVNNAGIGRGAPGSPRALSADGYELRFAVNYLAPVLLTRMLVSLLRRTAPARVVNVASATQEPLDFDDPMLATGYDGGRAYGRSKLAFVMFTFALADELRETGVTVNCLHPATRMPTTMTREASVAPESPLEHGVEATLRLVVARELDGITGRYYHGVHEARAHPLAYDVGARMRLARAHRRPARPHHGDPMRPVAADAVPAGSDTESVNTSRSRVHPSVGA